MSRSPPLFGEGSKMVFLPCAAMAAAGISTPPGLPITSSLYTVPALPLHSSGLNAEWPPTRVMLPAPQWLLDLQSSFDKAVSFHNRRTAYRSVTKAAWSQDCNLSALPLSLSEPNDGTVYVYLFPFPVSQMLSRNLTIQDPCYLIFKGNDRVVISLDPLGCLPGGF